MERSRANFIVRLENDELFFLENDELFFLPTAGFTRYLA